MNHDGPHADTLAAYRSIEDLPEGIVAHDAQIDRAGWRLESGIRPADEGAELVEIRRLYRVFERVAFGMCCRARHKHYQARSEEHTSELQSLMRISYAVFCLKKKKQ